MSSNKGNDDLSHDEKPVEESPTGRYIRFSERLGKGAFKTVYRGIDTYEMREVAWNTVNISNIPKKEKKRIVDEVNLLNTLNHKHLIQFYGSWYNKQTEQVVFVTEIMTAGTLKEYIMKYKFFKLKHIKNWCRQILEGLEYLHSQTPPIIHRDLKCDNIFIHGDSADICIGDLGLSTQARADLKSCLGTPEYMAPELYDDFYDEKVDIYAFGMCMLEMLTLEIPYGECSNVGQIYKKVTDGILPAALERVKDAKAKELIRDLLTLKSERPSAKQLLEDYDFFQETEDEDTDLPSETVSPNPDLNDNSPSPSADPLHLFPEKESTGEALDDFFDKASESGDTVLNKPEPVFARHDSVDDYFEKVHSESIDEVVITKEKIEKEFIPILEHPSSSPVHIQSPTNNFSTVGASPNNTTLQPTNNTNTITTNSNTINIESPPSLPLENKSDPSKVSSDKSIVTPVKNDKILASIPAPKLDTIMKHETKSENTLNSTTFDEDAGNEEIPDSRETVNSRSASFTNGLSSNKKRTPRPKSFSNIDRFHIVSTIERPATRNSLGGGSVIGDDSKATALNDIDDAGDTQDFEDDDLDLEDESLPEENVRKVSDNLIITHPPFLYKTDSIVMVSEDPRPLNPSATVQYDNTRVCVSFKSRNIKDAKYFTRKVFFEYNFTRDDLYLLTSSLLSATEMPESLLHSLVNQLRDTVNAIRKKNNLSQLAQYSSWTYPLSAPVFVAVKKEEEDFVESKYGLDEKNLESDVLQRNKDSKLLNSATTTPPFPEKVTEKTTPTTAVPSEEKLKQIEEQKKARKEKETMEAEILHNQLLARFTSEGLFQMNGPALSPQSRPT